MDTTDIFQPHPILSLHHRARRPRGARATVAILVTALVSLTACEGSKVQPPETKPATDEAPKVGGFGPTQERCDDATFPIVLEAEAAKLEGVKVVNALEGAVGDGYVGEFDEIGDSVTFSFCVPEAGYYSFDFRYANGSSEPAMRTIMIDGKILPGVHNFTARWSWSDFEPTTPSAVMQDSAPLTAGPHQLAVMFHPIDTGVMLLDQMTVTRGAKPSSTSVTGLLMNDRRELVAGVFASRIHPADDKDRPPRIGELRWRGNWDANNLDEATGYLRDVTGDMAYVEFDRNPLHTNITMREDGVLQMDYLNWGDSPLPAAIKKEHAAVPESGVLVVRYTVKNITADERSYSMLEYVDLNRQGTQAAFDVLFPSASLPERTGDMKVTWRPDLRAFIADLSALHGTFVVFGAFQAPDQLATGPAGGGMVSPSSGSGGGTSRELKALVSQFGGGEPLAREQSFTGKDAEMGMVKDLTLAAGAEAAFSYFYAVKGTLAEAEAAARTARGQTSDFWFETTSKSWASWLDQRVKLPEDADQARDTAYKVALVSIKQAQQPEFGSFVAATNPAYQFKVWPRDAAVVAMGLDAANFLDDAEHYWRWMASVQETGESPDFPVGTWWTNYSYWTADKGIPFVQPEWDSLGLFTIGVYRHYLLLLEKDGAQKANAFFTDMYPAVRRASDFISQNLDPNGFGPKDFSIWEDRFQWAAFTQVTYASGLTASYELAVTADKQGAAGVDLERAETWRTTARSIKKAMLAPYDQQTCTGLWRPDGEYFMRGIEPDCSPDSRVDAASNLMWVFGLLDVKEEKVQKHREKVLDRLTPNDAFQGISRFEDDVFYYSSIYSPGGTYESRVPETTWPQMSMYMSMAEHWLSLDETATSRLDWYISISAVGSMPPGEGIDWSTQQPLVSTAVEPVTGTWYVLSLLVNLNLFEPRLSQVGVDSDI